jgi:hypothetical protein
VIEVYIIFKKTMADPEKAMLVEEGDDHEVQATLWRPALRSRGSRFLVLLDFQFPTVYN